MADEHEQNTPIDNDNETPSASSTTSAPTRSSAAGKGDLLDALAGIQHRLDDVAGQLRQLNRMRRHREFSIARLVATIAQLLVVAMMFWIVLGIMDLGNIAENSALTLKFLGALIMQMFALTFFVIDRQDH
jgi:hypothetical protein